MNVPTELPSTTGSMILPTTSITTANPKIANVKFFNKKLSAIKLRFRYIYGVSLRLM
jgi:hypothetical protein